jgi:hypothetical protein
MIATSIADRCATDAIEHGLQLVRQLGDDRVSHRSRPCSLMV